MWRSGDWFFFLFFFIVSFIIGDHRLLFPRCYYINCTGGFTENSSCSVRGIVKMIGEELVCNRMARWIEESYPNRL